MVDRARLANSRISQSSNAVTPIINISPLEATLNFRHDIQPPKIKSRIKKSSEKPMNENYPNENHPLDLEKLTSLLGNNKIDETINNLIKNLYDLGEINLDYADVEATFSTIANSVDSGDIDIKYIANEHFHITFLDKKPNEKAARSLKLAHIYTYAAMQLKEHNSLMKAWHAVSEAQKYIWLCNGLYYKSARMTIVRASKGGKANAKKLKDFKQAVIDALQKFKPQRGWSSSSVAADKIIDHVLESLHKLGHKTPPDRNDVIANIRNMIEDDKEANAAYSSPKSN